MSVTLPVELAFERLRSVADKAEMRCVQATLREDDPSSEAPSAMRLKNMQTKVASGRAVMLAEVVRDSVQRRLTPDEYGKTRPLIPSEQDLYLKARDLLVDEIGLAQGVERSDADTWITAQLSHRHMARTPVR
jgi:RNA polymerase-interacting CarD/CdnL/TRCF family regulator